MAILNVTLWAIRRSTVPWVWAQMFPANPTSQSLESATTYLLLFVGTEG